MMHLLNLPKPKPIHERVPIEHSEPHEFCIVTQREILLEMDGLIRQTRMQLRKLQGGETIERGMCRVLLQHYGWKFQKLRHEARSKGVPKMLDTIGLKPERLVNWDLPRPKSKCGVCDGEFSRDEMHSLYCFHRFCFGCWNQYLSEKFEMNQPRIECMQPGCSCVVYDEEIQHILETTKAPLTDLKFKAWIFNVYLDENPYTKCKKVGCAFYVNMLCRRDRIRKIQCHCGRNILINPCCSEWHAPVPCKAWRMWKRHCSGTNDSVDTDLPTYKPCPGKRCRAKIEQNKGCLHMTCTTCHHEFCYFCMKPWRSEAHRGRTKVCSYLTRESIIQVSDETKLFRDARFDFSLSKFQKYSDPTTEETVKEKVTNNREVLKAFNLLYEEKSLRRFFRLLCAWSETLASLYVFDFFVIFPEDIKKKFQKRLNNFATSWDRLCHQLQLNLRITKKERNIREWFKTTETLVKEMESSQKKFLMKINKATDEFKYKFREPIQIDNNQCRLRS